jgi:hypothetical protein
LEQRLAAVQTQQAETAQRQTAQQQVAAADRTRPLLDDDFEVKQNNDNTITITKFKLKDRESVVIPEKLYGLPVTIITNFAFTSDSIRNVVIPDTVTSISSQAFEGNNSGSSKLERVTIGKGVRTIGYGAFRNNPNLTEITIPDSVTRIGERAFENCGLTSITWGKGLQVIDVYAFQYNKLTSVTLPNSLKQLLGYAFSGNPMQSISIPGSIEYLERGNFSANRLVLPANLENRSFGSSEESLRNFYVSQNRSAGTYVKNGPIWTKQ